MWRCVSLSQISGDPTDRSLAMNLDGPSAAARRSLYAHYRVLQFASNARAMPKACVSTMRRSAQDSVQLLVLLCGRVGGTDAGAPSHGHVLRLESARALMHRKCTVSVRGSNPPHTVNSPLQPTRRTTTEPCNENPYPSGTPRPSNAHPPGYNTDFKHIHTYTNYTKKNRRYGSTRSSATW